MNENDGIKPLEIYSVIGFDGNTIKGLNCHPDGIHIVFPMGNKICIQNWNTKKLCFLSGHTNTISTVAISSKGAYVGSGQINHIGFKAAVILWNFEKKTMHSKHELHKVRVESLCFSPDESLMISVGGRDCGQIVVCNTDTGSASYTAAAAKVTTGEAVTVSSLQRRSNSFITGGDGTLRAWNIDITTKTISVVDVAMGKLKRCIICITISDDDTYGYCGTTSGDIVKINIGYPSDPNVTPVHKPSMSGCYAKCGVWKKSATRPEIVCYCSGAQSILILNEELIIVGGGDGTVDCLKEIKRKTELPKEKLCTPVSPNFKVVKTKKLNGPITSIQIMEIDINKVKEKILLVGTKMSEIFSINLKTFQTTLIITCHNCPVNDIAFPKNMSDVFATAGSGDIRVWALKSCQELLRIQVANFACTGVLFAADGKSIVSAWNDGCIRAFTPLTGQLMYCILNAHNKGTSAIAMTDDGKTIISGGCEGQVRVWSIDQQKQKLEGVLKEHKCPVAAIKINNINTEAVSAGTDGSCIIWDIINLCRRQILFANTVFMCVCYEPSGCQILTGGSDRRVAYWEAGSGNLARVIEASRNYTVNTLDINNSGEYFVTGDNNQKVKLWKYQEGIFSHIGLGHSGVITTAKFSPDNQYIISASGSGSIFIWKFPKEYLQKPLTAISAKSGKSTVRLKLGVNKDENISTMNTSRSSIISSCPCTCKEKSSDSIKKQGNGDGFNHSCHSSCSNSKQNSPVATADMCTTPLSIKEK